MADSLSLIVFVIHCDECGENLRWSWFESDRETVCVKCKYGERSTKGQQYKAENAFIDKVESLGGKVLGEYTRSREPVQCRCKYGHICNPSPNGLQQGRGMCRTCAGKNPVAAEENFRKHVTEQGGQVVGKYMGKDIVVDCICPEGHQCSPRPNDIRNGQGMCKTCAGNYLGASKARFYKMVEDMGAEITGSFVNNTTPVICKCKSGHICNPVPNNVLRGQGICRKCVMSGGARLIEKALIHLQYQVGIEARNKFIPNLRYDFVVDHKNSICYLEYDGRQHFEFIRLYHQDKTGFDLSQERDRLKTYICNKQDIKLIRIDYTWMKRPLSDWIDFIKTALDSKENLVLSSPDLYKWIHERPSEETIDEFATDA